MTENHSPGSSLRVIAAPAGSGKTTRLLQDYLRHLQSGIHAERIVAITFTRKAASEMVERLGRILRCSAGLVEPDEEYRKLYAAVAPPRDVALRTLGILDSLPVCTVDSFVQSLLVQHALDARFHAPGSAPVWIDGPVEIAETASVYADAARVELEQSDSEHVQTLLGELTFGQAIGDIASLASINVPGFLQVFGAVTNGAFLETFQKAFGQTGQPLTMRDLHRHTYKTVSRDQELAARRDRAFHEAIARLGADFQPSPEFHDGLRVRRMDTWEDSGRLERADRFRMALMHLVPRVRARALEAMARTGLLGYEEILLAATTLCCDPPPDLAASYDVLMVDELQDTNPAQLSFYEAFISMRCEDPIQAFFVGDTRQSIYRFRHADPYGWQNLLEKAREDGAHEELVTNYRSTRLLIEAQRTVFEHLADMGQAGVDTLQVEPPEGVDRGTLDSVQYPSPIVVVDVENREEDAVQLCLSVFARRIVEQREKRPDLKNTAAVLVKNWATAERASRLLRSWGLHPQLTGDSHLLDSRIATDIRLFIRGLMDPSDDLSLAGMLKHPSIGISDRGLLILRQGRGLGALFGPDPSPEGLDGEDRTRLDNALPLLHEARARLGREPTADVIDWLAARLHWRPIIAAGPEGRDGVGIAQLEILLDIIRDAESRNVDPHATAETITPSEESVGDFPVVHLHGGPDVVTITTIYGAKGLEFDHVALLNAGSPGSAGDRSGQSYHLTMPRGRPVLGVKVDPSGGFNPALDPLGAIGAALSSGEDSEEGARLFYVGLTRAARSVTFALERQNSKTLTKNLIEVFIDDPRLDESLQVLKSTELTPQSIEVQKRTPMHRTASFTSTWASPSGLRMVRATSRDVPHVDPSAVVARFTEKARIVTGRQESPPRPDLPGIAPTTWGELVHGWMEYWAFRKDPTEESASAYLETRWSFTEPALSTWLVKTGLAIRDGLPGFAELLHHELHFELPLVAVTQGALLTGRPDLLVELPGRHMIIIDFKAGEKYATEDGIPGVSEYAVQLENYRWALEAAGYRIDEVGLLYTAAPSWARLKLA